MKKIYFENLDGLRFIAFLAVFIRHSIFSTNPVVIDSWIFKTIHIIKKPCDLGVPFFFCLSGFLITYLLLSEQGNFKKIHIGKFYIRRILRIWPLYYAVVIFGFFIFPALRSLFIHEPYVETATLWKYLVFMSNFDQWQNGLPYGAGLGVTWSLSVEEQFYLFWPLILTIVKPKYYPYLLITVFIGLNIALQFFDLPYSLTFESICDISIGAFLAVITYKKGPLFERFTQLSKPLIFSIYTIGIAHTYVLAVFGWGNRALVSLFMAFVIFDQCFCKQSVIKMGRFKWISYIGTLTYGLYLLHTISNFIIHNFIGALNLNSPFFTDLVMQPVLSFTLTFILGYLSFNYFEKPFLSLKSRYALIKTATK
jgi:peptidoglycan/LPS O-acetylase OafA/YrhL